MQCYDAAAAAFGWADRDPTPGSMRDGDWLVGWGCATAMYPATIAPANCRVSLAVDGRATVETGAHDIGTGLYTVVAQTAADRLGLPIDHVTVRLGDTNLPAAPLTAGSSGTASILHGRRQGVRRTVRRAGGRGGKGGGSVARAVDRRVGAAGRPTGGGDRRVGVVGGGPWPA